MAKYKKRADYVDAVKLQSDVFKDVEKELNLRCVRITFEDLETGDTVYVSSGDWIIRNAKGELMSLPPAYFDCNYEKRED